jgi:hypothetical protein
MRDNISRSGFSLKSAFMSLHVTRMLLICSRSLESCGSQRPDIVRYVWRFKRGTLQAAGSTGTRGPSLSKSLTAIWLKMGGLQTTSSFGVSLRLCRRSIEAAQQWLQMCAFSYSACVRVGRWKQNGGGRVLNRDPRRRGSKFLFLHS